MSSISDILKFRISSIIKLKENFCESEAEISESENEIIFSLMQNIISPERQNEYKLLYRGENKERMKSKLFNNSSDFTESKLFERLFYFGDKAKSYFSYKRNRNYLKTISDINSSSFEYIFEELSKIFNDYKDTATITDFKYDNKEFYDFFTEADNINLFVDNIMQSNDNEKLQLRDYYLYLLHTSEFWKLKKQTYFVSTSEKDKIALNYAKYEEDNPTGIVLIYFIKSPFSNAGINLEIINDTIPLIKKNGLPQFSSNLYPGEMEFAVKAGLFPHRILAIYDTTDGKLIINPHIFLMDNPVESILNNGSIDINQSGFSTKIKETGYYRYVSYFVNKKIYVDKHF